MAVVDLKRAARRVKGAALTQDRLKEIMHYDPETGILTRIAAAWRKDRIGKTVGSVAVRDNRQYLVCNIDFKGYYVHRVIWLYVTGSWPEGVIDHKNGDGLDNRWDNLRDASVAQNNCNRKPSKVGKIEFLGVHLNEAGSAVAQIGYKGKTLHIGTFSTIGDAVQARDAVARVLHGDFARLRDTE